MVIWMSQFFLLKKIFIPAVASNKILESNVIISTVHKETNSSTGSNATNEVFATPQITLFFKGDDGSKCGIVFTSNINGSHGVF